MWSFLIVPQHHFLLLVGFGEGSFSPFSDLISVSRWLFKAFWDCAGTEIGRQSGFTLSKNAAFTIASGSWSLLGEGVSA